MPRTWKAPYGLMKSLCLMLLIGMVSAGCANYGGMASSKMDSKAKEFKTDRDMAVIYVFRNNTDVDKKISVSLDGRVVARTQPKTFIKLKVKPGEHEISSDDGIFSSITLNTEAGENYFILQEVVQSANRTGANFLQVSELEGRRSVRDARLINSKR